MLGRKLETDSPGVHKLKALSKILLKSATASENFYDLHCAGFCGENIFMHNTKSWFLGCGEWTLSHLQDQQQTHKRNLRELQKGSWKSIRVGHKSENDSFLKFVHLKVNNELQIQAR